MWVGRASGTMVHDWWAWWWLRHGTALDAPWWVWVRGSDQRSRAIRKSRAGSIHPPASGTMAAKPKARQGRRKRRIAGTGTRTVCVCVCGCKGPGDGHVTDARKKKGAVGWTGTPWLARQGQPWRGWRRRGGGEAGRAVKGCRHVQRWHESRLANRWEIQGYLDRKASRRPREEKPCHGRVMVVDGWLVAWPAYLLGESK